MGIIIGMLGDEALLHKALTPPTPFPWTSRHPNALSFNITTLLPFTIHPKPYFLNPFHPTITWCYIGPLPPLESLDHKPLAPLHPLQSLPLCTCTLPSLSGTLRPPTTPRLYSILQSNCCIGQGGPEVRE